MSLKELEWINFLRQKVKTGESTIVGIGDDCALARIGREKLLLKSDIFVEEVHFRRKNISFKDIGKRAVARVFSDFAACGGEPKFIGVSAGVPSYIKGKDLKQILEGILFMCKKYNASLVGGDTSKSSKLILDIWGVGQASRCILRSTAKVGDYIFLTGKLGRRVFNRPFEPRIKEAKELGKKFKVNSMIDISDGFVIDLYRILKVSKKGAVIFKGDVPVTKGISDFYRGEDYELIFTVDKLEKKLTLLKKKYYLVGRIKSGTFGFKWESRGEFSDVRVKGFTHF